VTPVLTLLSYNIHSGVGLDGVLDLERIADVIAATGADVVALQEVDRFRREQSAFEDQPGVLARRLGMHVAYAANLDAEPAAARVVHEHAAAPLRGK
jgi:endonuclease/exonuclease/phosphatase family metal-dependent hydrolase